MRNCFNNATPDDRMETGPKALVTPTTPRHEPPDTEVKDMPFNGHYTDSASAGNSEQSSNWQSIGELAERLVRR